MTEPIAYDVERFKELNRQEWTDRSVVDGWRKWHQPYSEWAQPVTEKMASEGEIAPGMKILDLASGSGEPAITFARIVGADGHVTATDFGADMLSLAKAHAREAEVENITFQEVDAHLLPFEDESFDRVTCRHGVMYFGDHVQALREARRVLKPGGRVVLTANGPFEQPLWEYTLFVFMKHVEMPPPNPDAPDTFRFSPKGVMRDALESAGFRDVHEEHLAPEMFWPRPPGEVWDWFVDIAAPFKPLIDQLGDEKRDDVFEEIRNALARFSTEGGANVPFHYVFGMGTK